MYSIGLRDLITWFIENPGFVIILYQSICSQKVCQKPTQTQYIVDLGKKVFMIDSVDTVF